MNQNIFIESKFIHGKFKLHNGKSNIYDTLNYQSDRRIYIWNEWSSYLTALNYSGVI